MHDNQGLFDAIPNFGFTVDGKFHKIDWEAEIGDPTSFLPFKGGERFEQSKFLKPLTDGQRDHIKQKTGIELPVGAKGFPLQVLFWLWRNAEFYLSDLFDMRVTQKGFFAAKGTGKTAFIIGVFIFFLVNFDNVEVISFMKYQKQLFQVNESVKAWISFIRMHAGLDLAPYFELSDEFNPNKPNVFIARDWGKGRTRRHGFLRSFDNPTKIANGPKPENDGIILFAQFIEPVMFDDPNEVTANKMMEIGSVNKSSIFRYARDQGYTPSLLTDMNGWDEFHDGIILAEQIVPYDYDEMREKLTVSRIDINLDWRARRIARAAFVISPITENERKDMENLEISNKNLFMAQYWGANYSMSGVTPGTYRYSVEQGVQFVDKFPSAQEIVQKFRDNGTTNFEPFLTFGVDWGLNDATVLTTTFGDARGNAYRKLLYRGSNAEAKKRGNRALNAREIKDNLMQAWIDFLEPFFQMGFYSAANPAILMWDGGSRTMGEVVDDELFNSELRDLLQVAFSERHGKNDIKSRVDYDNEMHAKGAIFYPNEPETKLILDEYKNAKNKASEPEYRDERNNKLDIIDSFNTGEQPYRAEIRAFFEYRARR